MTAGSRPFIPAPNCASIEMIYSLWNQVVENVFHTFKGSPYSLADLQALRGLFNTWDSGTYASKRANGSTLTRIRTKALDTNTSPMEDYNLPAGRAGGQPGTQYAGNATWCVKLTSGLQGRSTRGRSYVPGITSQMAGVTGNIMSPSVATDIVNAYNTLISQLAAGGHTLCVVSYRTNKAWRTTAAKYAITQATYVDLNVDSQRRRLTGRGRS